MNSTQGVSEDGRGRPQWAFAVPMFLYFFLVITTFWVLKPLKSALFLEYYDASGFTLAGWYLRAAQAELLAKVLNMFVALAAAWIFARLARGLRREQLTYVFCAFFVVSFALFSQLIEEPGDFVVWSFYLLGDLFTTLMVTAFFAFLNDSVTPERARRLYGPIVLGGVLGGALGPTFLRLWIERFSASFWLWTSLAAVLVIAGTAYVAAGWVRRNPPPERLEPVSVEAPSGGRSAWEGATMILRSRYLLAIVAIVGFYEICSQVLDFQFKATVTHFLDGASIGKHMTLVYAISNWTALVVQLFLTRWVMTRFGVLTALLVLPSAVCAGSAGFLIWPMLWTGSLLNTADSGFAYSINQSSKEALYVPLSKQEKYQAKAFIDMFVQRFAKVLAIGVSLILTTWFQHFGAVRWLSVFVLVVALAWMGAARYAGRRFEEYAAELDRAA
jgi:AAA family ATP:ADP antiporter